MSLCFTVGVYVFKSQKSSPAQKISHENYIWARELTTCVHCYRVGKVTNDTC